MGCSTIPTAITAFLIDSISKKEKLQKQNELRKSFLYSIPYVCLLLSKTIVEEFYQKNNVKCKMIDAFKEAIYNMENNREQYISLDAHKKRRDKVYHNIESNLKLYDCSKKINDQKFLMQINKIFTEKELTIIENINKYYIPDIKNHDSLICEMGEFIKILISSLYDSIPEIYIELNIQIVINNKGFISNWVDLSI